MSSYEMLDAIADAINPLLLITAMILPMFLAVRRRVRVDRWYLSAAMGIALVYTMMYADRKFSLWSSIGSDYSTHTAFALVICMLLGIVAKQYVIGATIIFLAYASLMHYQRYHTMRDMVTTAIAIAAVYAVTLFLLNPRRSDMLARS